MEAKELLKQINDTLLSIKYVIEEMEMNKAGSKTVAAPIYEKPYVVSFHPKNLPMITDWKLVVVAKDLEQAELKALRYMTNLEIRSIREEGK